MTSVKNFKVSAVSPPIADGGVHERRCGFIRALTSTAHDGQLPQGCARRFRDCVAQMFVNGDRVSLSATSVYFSSQGQTRRKAGAQKPVCRSLNGGLPTMALAFGVNSPDLCLLPAVPDYTAVSRKCWL